VSQVHESEVIEIAREIRERVGDLRLADANEAATRLKIIDDVIRTVLAWTVADIHPEERVSEDGKTKYVDYIIRTANTAIVIEAKRVGSAFDIGSAPDRRVQLTPGFVKGELGDAIIQARDYGRAKSIPFAVVTNGHQWVIFPSTRTDQIEFNKSSAIVFDSLESALGTNVDYFVSLLSRDGVVDGFLERELIGRTEDQLQERRLKNVIQKDVVRPPNPIYHLIENEVVDCFADTIVGRSKEFLELCYVPTPDRTKFDSRIKMHLRRRDALFSTRVHRPLRDRESGAVKKAIEGAARNNRSLALLVLGSVGAGKTTYLTYTRQVVTDEFFATRKDREYPHWIYVDLRAVPGGGRPIDAIYSSIFEYFRADDFFSSWDRAIRSAYKDEIDSLRRGPLSLIASSEEEFKKRLSDVVMNDYNNVKPYVDKLIRYASSKQPVFLVIDNVDQFESEEFQGQVFADAISFASRFNINLVLAMREDTFVRHRNHSSFDAFDFDPLSIEPPEITAVLSKRFLVLRKALEGKSGYFTAENGARFDVDDLSVFADIVQRSVLGTEIGTRIEVLANKDVRLALRMTREFLERGYTEPAKAISLHRNKGQYVLPRHEAFRAILLGNQNVYSEAFSVIGNPFDSRLSRSSSQMLRMFVLSGLVKFGSDATAEFVEGAAIRDVCRKLGYGDAAVSKVVDDLCRLRFCQTASHEAPGFGSSFFATRLGGHIVRELIADFTFLEAMLMDTFISHDGLWDSLKELSRAIGNERDTVRRINLRVERIRKFWKNLSDQYFLLLSEALRRGLPAEWCTNPFAELERTFEANCSRVSTSAARIYGQKSGGG
jgi:hypothetical protein